MKNHTGKIKKIFTTSAVLFLLFFPALGFVRAADTDYTLLAPLPNISEDSSNCTPLVVNSDGTTSGGCKTNLSTYLPAAFNLIIGIAAVLAFIMLTYGGVLYMTSDAISNKSEGKTKIENALWGLLLVIASWLILNTINPAMTSFNFNLAPPNTTAQTPDQLATIQAAQTASGLTASGADLLSGNALTADQYNRSVLGQEGIAVNNPPCGGSANLTSNCTDVNLLKPAFMQDLNQMATSICNNNASCNNCQSSNSCPVTMTGGNEGSLHNTDTTHSTGDTADFSPTSALNNYLGNTSPSNGTQVTKNGVTFTYETAGANAANTGAHWHATICTGPSPSSCP